jgi:hypothetical protein
MNWSLLAFIAWFLILLLHGSKARGDQQTDAGQGENPVSKK